MLYLFAISVNVLTLSILWDTGRKLRRLEDSTDALEDAMFRLEGTVAGLEWGRKS